MATLKELFEKYNLPKYQASYDLLFRVVYKLHQWGETEIEMTVLKKLAGLKMMIDHIKSM